MGLKKCIFFSKYEFEKRDIFSKDGVSVSQFHGKPNSQKAPESFAKICEDLRCIYSEDIDGMPQIRDTPIPYLADWITLTKINLRSLDLDQEELKALLPHLVYVNLEGYSKTELSCYLLMLKDSTKLAHLEVSWIHLSDETFTYLSRLTQLKFLDFLMPWKHSPSSTSFQRDQHLQDQLKNTIFTYKRPYTTSVILGYTCRIYQV